MFLMEICFVSCFMNVSFVIRLFVQFCTLLIYSSVLRVCLFASCSAIRGFIIDGRPGLGRNAVARHPATSWRFRRNSTSRILERAKRVLEPGYPHNMRNTLLFARAALRRISRIVSSRRLRSYTRVSEDFHLIVRLLRCSSSRRIHRRPAESIYRLKLLIACNH